MDQKKTGRFMKELRKEKGFTQEQLAEQLNVSGRTVSRWETGNNMPDLDLLIEMADFYGIELRELIDGERKSETMNEEMKETVLKVADYSNEEKSRLMRKLHYFSWIGVVTFLIFMILEASGLAANGILEDISSFCCGISFGILLTVAIYTNRNIHKFQVFKRRILQRMKI